MKRVWADNRRHVSAVQRLGLHLLIQSPFGGFRFIVGSGGGIDGEIAIRTLCSAQRYFVTGHLKFVS